MARKCLWLVTLEQGSTFEGWTEKSHFKAGEAIAQLKKAPGAENAEFRLFRLSLVDGKIYANRIIEKEKVDAKFNSGIDLTAGSPTGSTLAGDAIANGGEGPIFSRVSGTK